MLGRFWIFFIRLIVFCVSYIIQTYFEKDCLLGLCHEIFKNWFLHKINFLGPISGTLVRF